MSLVASKEDMSYYYYNVYKKNFINGYVNNSAYKEKYDFIYKNLEQVEKASGGSRLVRPVNAMRDLEAKGRFDLIKKRLIEHFD